jgi:anthranilate phosphoribosyltransferase
MAAITRYIEQVLQGESLSFEEASKVLDIVFEGEVSEAQIAAFLAGMRAKGVSATELAGLARSLRSHAVPVKVDVDNLVDTCGTGGAKIKTFNISTASALVAAGAGVHVAKHGNRGITSSCGSADVLAELGVKIDASAEIVAKCIREAHIGFMFAPLFHPAMKYVQPVRKALGFRTVFNILGPLANPAGVTAQVMGVADESLMQRIAEALKLLGTRRGMVVHSDGLDEIGISRVTKIIEIRNGQVSDRELDPEELGISLVDVEQLKVGDVKTSAAVLRDIVNGREQGPRRDIVVLNAAAAILAGNLAENLESALQIADASVSEGKASACLEKLIEISNSKV